MVKEEKLKAVEKLAEDLGKYKVVGVIDLYKFPTNQMQIIKKKLSDKVVMKVIKKSILLRAFEKFENLKPVQEKLPSQPAILLTDEDPFKTYLTISNLKSDVFAKDGDTAEYDIEVYAGPTNLLAGPVISEFAKVKIPTGVEAGKIAIKKDKTVAKKGDIISGDLASILRKLNIRPIKIGLNVVCLFDGNLYLKEVLDLVGDNYLNKLKEAFAQALNLSVALGYPTKENIGHLLSKAYNEAKYLEDKIIGGVKQDARSV